MLATCRRQVPVSQLLAACHVVTDAGIYLGICCAGAAAGGLAACSQGGGDSLVHVGCGDGALTKMLASKGLRVFGVDVSIEAAAKRGLRCTAYQGLPLSTGSLAAAAAAAGGTVDVVLLFTAPQVSSKGDNFSKSGDYPITSKECFQLEALQELSRLLSPGGRLCLEVPIAEGDDAAAVLTSLLQQAPAAGFKSTSHAQVVPGAYQERVRVIAQRDV